MSSSSAWHSRPSPVHSPPASLPATRTLPGSVGHVDQAAVQILQGGPPPSLWPCALPKPCQSSSGQLSHSPPHRLSLDSQEPQLSQAPGGSEPGVQRQGKVTWMVRHQAREDRWGDVQWPGLWLRRFGVTTCFLFPWRRAVWEKSKGQEERLKKERPRGPKGEP